MPVNLVPYGEPDRCPSCQALIVWAMAEDGTISAINFESHHFGELLLFYEEDFFGERRGDLHFSRRATPDDPPGPRWLPHFATCPARLR